MKTLIATISFCSILLLTSCSKEHICTCNITSNGQTTTSTITIEGNKSAARTTCEANNGTQNLLGIEVTTSCSLD